MKIRRVDRSFVGLLGDSATAKIWAFLLYSKGDEYLLADMAKGTKLTRQTTAKLVKTMLKQNVVVKGGKLKGMQLYKINMDSEVVKSFARAFDAVLKQ